MREYTLYMWIGVWLFILPFLGIPGSWKEILLMITAFFVIVQSFTGYRRIRRMEEARSSGAKDLNTPPADLPAEASAQARDGSAPLARGEGEDKS